MPRRTPESAVSFREQLSSQYNLHNGPELFAAMERFRSLGIQVQPRFNDPDSEDLFELKFPERIFRRNAAYSNTDYQHVDSSGLPGERRSGVPSVKFDKQTDSLEFIKTVVADDSRGNLLEATEDPASGTWLVAFQDSKGSKDLFRLAKTPSVEIRYNSPPELEPVFQRAKEHKISISFYTPTTPGSRRVAKPTFDLLQVPYGDLAEALNVVKDFVNNDDMPGEILLPYGLGSVIVEKDDPALGIREAMEKVTEFKNATERIGLHIADKSPEVGSETEQGLEAAQEKIKQGFAFINTLALSAGAKERINQRIAAKELGL